MPQMGLTSTGRVRHLIIILFMTHHTRNFTCKLPTVCIEQMVSPSLINLQTTMASEYALCC